MEVLVYRQVVEAYYRRVGEAYRQVGGAYRRVGVVAFRQVGEAYRRVGVVAFLPVGEAYRRVADHLRHYVCPQQVHHGFCFQGADHLRDLRQREA